MEHEDDGAWFAPKRYGYGTGLPISWQGWACLAAFLAMLVPYALLLARPEWSARVGAFVLIGAATGLFVRVCKVKTRGGWKWRWGKD